MGRVGRLKASWHAVVAALVCAGGLSATGASAASAAPFAYVANNGSGDVSAFAIGPGGGLTALPGLLPMAGAGPVGVAVSPDGAHLYVTNAGSNNISAFSIGPGGGLSALPGPLPMAGMSPVGVAVSPNGAYLYVTNRNSNDVSAFSIGPGGGLTALVGSPFTVAPLGANPERVAVSPDGTHLYVTNSGTDNVSAFSIGPGGGLTAVPGSPFTVAPPAGRFPFGVAVTPDGRHLYVTNSSSDNVSALSIMPGGGLTSLPGSPFTVAPGTDPAGVAVSPDGARLYVANGNIGNPPGSVSAFSIGPGGRLTALMGSPFPAGTNTNEVAVSPDGAHLYATNGGSSNVSAFSIGPGGRLTALPGPLPGAGANPIGVATTPPSLTVSKNGSGSGTVTSSPFPRIACGGTCSASFAAGTMVTLTATPDSGSAFAGWSGAGCSGTATCTVTMSSDWAVTATFTARPSPPPPPPPPPPSGCPDPAGAYNQGFNAGFNSARGIASPAKALPPACNPQFNQGFNTGFNSAPLTLTNVSQSHRRWRLGSNLARFAAAAKPPVGTTFQFTLNKAATVRFTFDELLPGRTVNKVNGKCVAQTARNRRHKACTRSVPRGSLSFSAGAGVRRLFFQGRLTRTSKLIPGTYALTITATNAAGQRATKTLSSFTIVLR